MKILQVPGQPSIRTLNYLKSLKAEGCPKAVLDQLKIDLFFFEMASIKSDYAEAVLVFTDPPKDYVIPFLKELNPFIKALSSALRLAELQRKAMSNSRDSLAAQRLLADITSDNGDVSESSSVADQLQEMADKGMFPV